MEGIQDHKLQEYRRLGFRFQLEPLPDFFDGEDRAGGIAMNNVHLKHNNILVVGKKTNFKSVREAPRKFTPGAFGHCPCVCGGGLDPCPDGLGHFLEKNFPSSNGHFLDFGGV